MAPFDSPPSATSLFETTYDADLRYAPPAPDENVPSERSARASQRITALGEMTAGLAHDFRNILAVIETGLSLAERNRGDPAKAEACIAAAHEGIRRGVRLTSQLLAFAKPRKPDIHAEDMNGLLEGLRTFLKYGAGPGISVVLDLAPDLPKCLVDPPKFNAAILNLVVNARDAMPEGGEIRIATAFSREENVTADGTPLPCVRVRVADQGCGMAPEVVRNIFDPFFTTKGEAGTGLGVPQVAAFMRASGGTVRVASAPGAGTRFDLLFPTADFRNRAGGSLWRQLDRWVNEGGRNMSQVPRFGH